jgi:hypothetical protein
LDVPLPVAPIPVGVPFGPVLGPLDDPRLGGVRPGVETLPVADGRPGFAVPGDTCVPVVPVPVEPVVGVRGVPSVPPEPMVPLGAMVPPAPVLPLRPIVPPDVEAPPVTPAEPPADPPPPEPPLPPLWAWATPMEAKSRAIVASARFMF